MDAAESLLFRTENVTLDGSADFALDGFVFKNAKGTLIRDGERSFLKVDLHTPGTGRIDNDPDIDSGFTVTADREQIWVTEVRHPGVYKIGYIFPRSTVLRQSVQLDLMARLARDLAKQADGLLGEGAVTAADTAEGGKEIRFVLDENAPDLVHTALTLAFQAVASRYFSVNYDQLSSRYMGPVDGYFTLTRGILYTTEYLYLRQADVTVVLDAAGELQDVSGVLGAYLQTGGDGEHELDITFRLNVSGRGSSQVPDFDPAGLVPAGSDSQPSETPAEEAPLPADENPAGITGRN